MVQVCEVFFKTALAQSSVLTWSQMSSMVVVFPVSPFIFCRRSLMTLPWTLPSFSTAHVMDLRTQFRSLELIPTQTTLDSPLLQCLAFPKTESLTR